MGEAIEAHMQNDNIQEAWGGLKSWYRTTTGWQKKPTLLDLETITAEYIELYAFHTLPGGDIPIMVDLSNI